MKIPSLRLTGIGSATAYRFSATEHFGWAICTVNDATCELSIQSDRGTWAFRWSGHFGGRTLTGFIADMEVGSTYIADKLTSRYAGGEQPLREVFSPSATVRAIGRRVRELYDAGRIDRETRREIGRAMQELEGIDDQRDFGEKWDELELDRWGGPTIVREVLGIDLWEYAATEPTRSYLVLRDAIIPALVAACAKAARPTVHAAEGEAAYA